MAVDILTGNVTYNKYIDRWNFMYRSYLGGMEYRNAGYLTRYAEETDKEYEARLLSTPLDNHVKSIISTYNSFLFREEPERDFGELENLPDIENFMDDCDLDGRSLNHFMKEVSTWAQVFGHCWILMTKPDVGAKTLAEEQLLGIRPYVNLLTPLTVLDWRYTRAINGKYELEYLKYIEEINGSIHVLKEWNKDEIITTVYDAQNRNTMDTIVEKNGLGSIPAVIAYSHRSIIRGIGSSPIDDVCDLQRYIYNCYSESEQSIRLDSHPSLVVTAETQVGTGVGSLITIPNIQDPGHNPYVIDYNGASIQSIYEVINNTIIAIEKNANVSGIRVTASRTLSGVALEIEFQQLNASLAVFADNLEAAEEAIWELYCNYQQLPNCIEVIYPNSFNIKDGEKEIDQLVTAKNAATDARVLRAIDMEILDWLELDEDEITAMMNANLVDLEAVPEQSDYAIFVPIKMIDPVSGNIINVTTPEQQLQLAKSGYVKMDD